ncbi:hypothetical protein ASPWEDRAFT_561306 [Aspergillus wentii DTO 134E9]|uniref:Uncharacterized protein n=1 Tax=Aspergillus wentii DTO 134E9 TaxID=1073089 RepID=A0A1L9RGS3_ASPWE|nr:uncharacterized protein ASPWEDRAFT_561306 [Aspergillus wentii DTO 134E9]OJJ34136.1 hypothetical protein ASPWEDRAFT_561306 [Aspergillus wentii DTO 134E9]
MLHVRGYVLEPFGVCSWLGKVTCCCFLFLTMYGLHNTPFLFFLLILTRLALFLTLIIPLSVLDTFDVQMSLIEHPLALSDMLFACLTQRIASQVVDNIPPCPFFLFLFSTPCILDSFPQNEYPHLQFVFFFLSGLLLSYMVDRIVV